MIIHYKNLSSSSTVSAVVSHIMPFVWNPANGMLVLNQIGAVLDVQYANPAI